MDNMDAVWLTSVSTHTRTHTHTYPHTHVPTHTHTHTYPHTHTHTHIMIHIGYETIIGCALIGYTLWKTDRKSLVTVLIGFAGMALAILGRHACGW